MTQTHNVTWHYRGHASRTQCGTEAEARALKAALHKRGIKIVVVSPV